MCECKTIPSASSNLYLLFTQVCTDSFSSTNKTGVWSNFLSFLFPASVELNCNRLLKKKKNLDSLLHF